MRKLQSRGFTLVELMIATSIFSVIMMISLYSFLQISRYYTKGISIIRTQDATRNLAADIVAQLQMSSGLVETLAISPSGYYRTCLGNKIYQYAPNIIEDGTGRALASYSNLTALGCAAVTPDNATKQVLLKTGTRLLELTAVPVNGTSAQLFSVNVALLFAPDDGDGSLPGTELVETGTDPTVYSQWRCKTAVKGSEYCALSRISTMVYRRVN